MTHQDLASQRDATLETIKEMIQKAHDPALAQIDGQHVTQIWWDGELTSQKGGSLLGLRTIHSFDPGFSFPSDQRLLDCYNISKEIFPNSGGSAYVTSHDAILIRQALGRYHILVLALSLKISVEFGELTD